MFKVVKKDNKHYAVKKRQGYKDTYENWTQPVMASNFQDGIVVSASSTDNYEYSQAYCALNGIKSGTPTTREDGWNCGDTTTGWWQVIFPYELRITKLIRYNNYLENTEYNSIKGQFFTNSSKTTPIGDAINVTNETNWFSQEITPSSPVITDTIYFAKTGGDAYSGIGELDIIAQKVVPVKVDSGADYYKDEYFAVGGNYVI